MGDLRSTLGLHACQVQTGKGKTSPQIHDLKYSCIKSFGENTDLPYTL